MKLIRFIFGNPLKTESMASEKLTKIKALAIFSSDILSSIAYATEEILLALGILYSCFFSLPIAGIITCLLFVIVASYWQAIEAYPNGGGAFIVAKENLGEFFSLIAGAALLIDYTLTVAVSLSAGASAIISAFPAFSNYTVSICLSILFLIVILNLRGSKESANVLSIPTYSFIGLMFLMIACGVSSSTAPKIAQQAAPNISSWVVFVLILRAFASGCSVLTGIDTIASNVTAFKKPRCKNAQITLLFMALILSVMFLESHFWRINTVLHHIKKKQ